jgi:hypothetical protein
MKIDSAACKEAIASYCKVFADRVAREFSPPLGSADVAQAFKPGNWKRICRERSESGGVVRIFDCRPFDDQLRAYVEASPAGDSIVGITVQGE